ncbi:hypothetical protein DOTSEDRAFT_61864 [Dothistroma septosporum NZE10]|uniref:Uncharacterized protein n=1 Tax=Dothistroma septosporum (strain NZE10 / CBS 128990) TaxID=675120 RepID=N1PPH0_DOTSN|nr:hypothetical protein DOTSEDRAFT_61864 [Dothistroma septosporum NZE10]
MPSASFAEIDHLPPDLPWVFLRRTRRSSRPLLGAGTSAERGTNIQHMACSCKLLSSRATTARGLYVYQKIAELDQHALKPP